MSTLGPPTTLKIADVPTFVKRTTGIDITRQTAYNWRKYGKQGTKLQATKTAKGYYTTEDKVRDFLSNISR